GAALVWLIQFEASGEAAWRRRTADGVSARQANSVAPARAELPAQRRGRGEGVHQAAALAAPQQVDRAGGMVQDLRSAGTERFEKADNYAKQLEQLQPALWSEPSVRFSLAAAHRQLGLPRQAERYYLSLRHGRTGDAWRDCAQTELWMIEPK